MIKLIKSMPWGVKVALVFLLAVYVLMCIMVPWIGLGLGVGVGTILSILRVAHYFQFGD
jgi:hypothetical protein